MKAYVHSLFIKSGPSIVTDYVGGFTLYVGRPCAIRAHARIVAVPGSVLGQVVFKWQGTVDPSDPSRWEDLASKRDDSGVVELEHSYPVVAGEQVSHSFTVDPRGMLALQLLARATGGDGQAGEEVLVDGVSW